MTRSEGAGYLYHLKFDSHNCITFSRYSFKISKCYVGFFSRAWYICRNPTYICRNINAVFIMAKNNFQKLKILKILKIWFFSKIQKNHFLKNENFEIIFQIFQNFQRFELFEKYFSPCWKNMFVQIFFSVIKYVSLVTPETI